jgi:hypothetical protein
MALSFTLCLAAIALAAAERAPRRALGAAPVNCDPLVLSTCLLPFPSNFWLSASWCAAEEVCATWLHPRPVCVSVATGANSATSLSLYSSDDLRDHWDECSLECGQIRPFIGRAREPSGSKRKRKRKLLYIYFHQHRMHKLTDMNEPHGWVLSCLIRTSVSSSCLCVWKRVNAPL